jgi:hypothetical protein
MANNVSSRVSLAVLLFPRLWHITQLVSQLRPGRASRAHSKSVDENASSTVRLISGKANATNAVTSRLARAEKASSYAASSTSSKAAGGQTKAGPRRVLGDVSNATKVISCLLAMFSSRFLTRVCCHTQAPAASHQSSKESLAGPIKASRSRTSSANPPSSASRPFSRLKIASSSAASTSRPPLESTRSVFPAPIKQEVKPTRQILAERSSTHSLRESEERPAQTVGKRGRSQSETVGFVPPGAPRIGSWLEDAREERHHAENGVEVLDDAARVGNSDREAVGLGVRFNGTDWVKSEMEKDAIVKVEDSDDTSDDEMEVADDDRQLRDEPLPLDVEDDEDEMEEYKEVGIHDEGHDDWMILDPDVEEQAKAELDAIRAEFKEELDFADTTMVAEYADEIFDYMGELEVRVGFSEMVEESDD